MPRLLWCSLVLVGCLPGLPTVAEPCGEWPDPGVFKVKLDEDEFKKRDAWAYIPAGDGPRDVVVLLHGLGASGADMLAVTAMTAEADRLGLVVVYPNATGFPNAWNAAPELGVDEDDTSYLDALARHVTSRVCGRRTLAIGFSNGASMAQRWACQGTEVQAIGVSSGPLAVEGCDSPPVPIRYYQGTADPIVPIDGGGNYPEPLPSLAETMERWREHNSCTDEATVTTTGDTTCTAWTCAVPTEQCVVEGWGHMWPGGRNGSATQAEATQSLLEFFRDATPQER